MTAYYNEFDKHAAAWLRELIAEGHIAPGDVDERDIQDVLPSDLAGYAQCHFFAGIGVWSYALRQAGWPDDRPVWTGSCPCQPFCAAGKGLGFADERHMWPFWNHLIRQCRPPVIIGEQSAQASEWLFLVRGDLEAMGYAVGAMPFEAASSGAFNLRDRIYFVADANGSRLEKREGHARVLRASSSQPERENASNAAGPGVSWFNGPDGKRRPFECGVFPVAYGDSARVVKLRGYGNAINAKAAETFVSAYLEARA